MERERGKEGGGSDYDDDGAGRRVRSSSKQGEGEGGKLMNGSQKECFHRKQPDASKSHYVFNASLKRGRGFTPVKK